MDAFFPFNPRATRLGFMLGAVACAALAIWAAWGGLRGTEQLAGLRAGLSAALMVAFLLPLWRLRPREGWGVTLDASGVTLSRPLSGEPLRLPWSEIANARKEGKREDVLVVRLKGGALVRVARHLFARRATFDALAAALRERVPEPVLDA